MKYYSKETGALAYNSESEYLESQLKTYLEEIEECDLDDYPSFKEWIENDDAWTFDVEDEDREWSDEACECFGELCEKYNGVYEAYCLCDEDGAVIPGTEYRTLEELLKKEPEEDIRKVSLVRQTKSEYIETVRDLDESEFK